MEQTQILVIVYLICGGGKPSGKPKLMIKVKQRKGLWSPDEDERLRNYILQHGYGRWSSVPINAGLERNGKSCRLRWINYLRPGLKRGKFTAIEDETILTLHRAIGNKWSQIAQQLPGRTDNEIKNYWHSYLKKQLQKPEQKDQIQATSPSSPEDKNMVAESTTNSTSAKILSPELFEYGEGSSTHQTDHQSAPQVPHHVCSSSLPKLLFAEWLAVDVDGTSNNIPHAQTNFHVEAEQAPTKENSVALSTNCPQFDILEVMQDLTAYNEGPSSSVNNDIEYLYHHGEGTGTAVSAEDQILHSPLKFEGVTVVTPAGSWLESSFPGEETCANFFIPNDQMYM